MLIPVMGPGEHDPAFVPDDLLRVKEPDAKQAIQDFAVKMEACHT